MIGPSAPLGGRLLGIGAVKCRMRCVIGFFGITRSLQHTAEAIRTGFYQPLENAGSSLLRVGHFNLPETIINPRSGEFGIAADRRESGLLDLDLCWIEPQRYDLIARQLEFARQF